LKYTCTVLTKDGKLRVEVTHLNMGLSPPDIFEGMALTGDVKLVEALVSEPGFQTAAGQNTPGPKMVLADGRALIAEANLDNKRQTVAFYDRTGSKATPSYLVGLLSFVAEVKSRKLFKIKGKAQSMCPPISPM
jgi:hypothetical protein